MASRFESKDLRQAINKLYPLQKKSRRELCVQAARGFIKEIVDITPPNSAKVTGQAAKKAGEAAVQADVLKLAQPVFAKGKAARSILATAAELLALHDRSRSNSGGRVNPRNRKEKLFVLQSVVVKVILDLQKRVGWLAAGWIQAAAKYKVPLAAWIKRHPSSPGDANEIDTATRFRIVLANAVKYVGSIKDYERRVDKAVQYQAGKMDRQAEALLKKNLKSAGW